MKTTALLLSLLSLAACSGSGRPQGCCTSDGFPAPGKEIVWTAAEKALAEVRMDVDREASSIENATIVSRWKTQLQPFAGQGHREQATIQINEVPGRPNYWHVETTVIRETNDNVMQPNNPVTARWGGAERAPELENVITRRIEMYFLNGRVSDKFKERYGLEGYEDARIERSDFPQPTPNGR